MSPGLRGKKSIIFYFLSSDIFFTMIKMFLKIQLVILTIIYRDTLEESPRCEWLVALLLSCIKAVTSWQKGMEQGNYSLCDI